MILGDVSYEMSLLNLQPMLIAGTLLGAYRNGTIIRWTRDVDLLYNLTSFDQAREMLATALERLGYNLFLEGIWRMCINSNHPLVANIFEGNRCANALAGYGGKRHRASLIINESIKTCFGTYFETLASQCVMSCGKRASFLARHAVSLTRRDVKEFLFTTIMDMFYR